ncbi:uncharacterized protein BHQ10_002468 [Talaromyces amestolkiae]|uniref:Uncharacterized protein n=1 Tax=Talaromyces amestolkiae TaxID=1196081 RepID=A0A364KSD4_TALAM|nr:uncharacterized protein BHQ10_002468 [Talaromyces amestolkiae]RAO66456.1 hypothetical protein BHQ10_002468 [Talaromyces amestolkiae]
MARVSQFTEEFDATFTSFPGLERPITLVDEKNALRTSTESVANTKTTTNVFAGAFKAARRLCASYKCHFNELLTCNFRQGNTHDDDKSIEAGSIFTASYGAAPTSAEELEQQSRRNKLSAIFGLLLDDDSSAFTAYNAKKQPTTAITKTQATATLRTPDAPTFWGQVCVTKGDTAEVIMTGYESEIENIDNNTNAELEFLAYLGVVDFKTGKY